MAYVKFWLRHGVNSGYFEKKSESAVDSTAHHRERLLVYETQPSSTSYREEAYDARLPIFLGTPLGEKIFWVTTLLFSTVCYHGKLLA
jgi:hypothetical protein